VPGAGVVDRIQGSQGNPGRQTARDERCLQFVEFPPGTNGPDKVL
jgi:hypothetical protein